MRQVVLLIVIVLLVGLTAADFTVQSGTVQSLGGNNGVYDSNYVKSIVTVRLQTTDPSDIVVSLLNNGVAILCRGVDTNFCSTASNFTAVGVSFFDASAGTLGGLNFYGANATGLFFAQLAQPTSSPATFPAVSMRSIALGATVSSTDLFGSQIAICGSYIAIGAPGANSNSGGVWIKNAANAGVYLPLPSASQLTAGMPNARLGTSIAMNELYLVAGMPGYDGNAGGIVLFPLSNVAAPSGSQWIPKILLPSTPALTWQLGISVAIDSIYSYSSGHIFALTQDGSSANFNLGEIFYLVSTSSPFSRFTVDTNALCSDTSVSSSNRLVSTANGVAAINVGSKCFGLLMYNGANHTDGSGWARLGSSGGLFDGTGTVTVPSSTYTRGLWLSNNTLTYSSFASAGTGATPRITLVPRLCPETKYGAYACDVCATGYNTSAANSDVTCTLIPVSIVPPSSNLGAIIGGVVGGVVGGAVIVVVIVYCVCCKGAAGAAGGAAAGGSVKRNSVAPEKRRRSSAKKDSSDEEQGFVTEQVPGLKMNVSVARGRTGANQPVVWGASAPQANMDAISRMNTMQQAALLDRPATNASAPKPMIWSTLGSGTYSGMVQQIQSQQQQQQQAGSLGSQSTLDSSAPPSEPGSKTPMYWSGLSNDLSLRLDGGQPAPTQTPGGSLAVPGQARTTNTAAFNHMSVQPWEIAYEDIEMVSYLGRGAYGEVWKAHLWGTVVAAKVLLKADKTIREDFEHEVGTLTRMRHPNVVLFMGASLTKLCIVTEFVPQGSLFDILRERPNDITPQIAMRLAIGVAKGMNYLHQQRPPIIHRDLKSPNVLVDLQWDAKIADFGLSKVKAATFADTMCGSPPWMAPEVVSGGGYAEAADTYSWGVTLWELVTKRLPYEHLMPVQVIAAKLGAIPVTPLHEDLDAGVPAFIVDLIRDCTLRDPAARPSFKQILVRLDAGVSGMNIITATPVTALPAIAQSVPVAQSAPMAQSAPVAQAQSASVSIVEVQEAPQEAPQEPTSTPLAAATLT